MGVSGPRLAEQLGAEAVRLERLHVQLLRVRQTQQDVRIGVPAGDQVRAALRQAQVEHLHVVGALARGQLPCGRGHLRGVLTGGHEHGDAAVEHLVRAQEHHVLVRGRHHVLGDAIAAAQDGADGDGLGHGLFS